MELERLPAGGGGDYVANVVNANSATLEDQVDSLETEDASLQSQIDGLGGAPTFAKTAMLTSAAAATGAILIDDSEVPSGDLVQILSITAKVNGSTAWADDTATVVTLQDTADTPVVGATIPKASLKANALLTIGSTGMTVGDAVALGSGFSANKGIVIIGDANFSAGDTLYVTISGFFRQAPS